MKSRAWWAIAALVAASVLQACGGGGGGGGSGAVRLVNLSDDYASLDLYTSDGTTETKIATAVTTDTGSTYTGLGATTYTFNLKRNGSSTTSSTSSRTVLSDTSHTLLAYTTGSALKSVFLTDNETAPTTGAAKVRVFNAAGEAGTVDIYITDPAATLAGSSPTTSALAGERIGAYTEVGAGTYRLRVTGTGDTTDLRLDVSNITLTAGQIVTLVLTTTPGGVLVNAHLVNQKDTIAAARNVSARVRLVSGAAGGAVAGATVNGTVLSSAQASPGIGSYQLVNAGALTVNATLGGAAATPHALPATLGAGTDNTLLVSGSGTNGIATLINDDNRPPLISTNAKLRLVHGVANLASPMTLTADFSVVATDVATNSGSTPLSVPGNLSTTTTQLTVTSPGLLTSPYDKPNALLATHTYTMFVLGDAAAPTGVLRRDR